MQGISRCLDIIGEWPAFLAVLAMGLTIVAGVVARYIFGYPLHFVEEWNGYFNVVLILLPLRYVLKHGGHLGLDITLKYLPRSVLRVLEIATLSLSLVIVIVLTISTTQLTITSFARGTRAFTTSETLLGPIQIVMPIGFAMLAIQTIAELAKKIKPKR